MKLKVCGMKYKDNIAKVAQLQPDYLGFIFYEKSARFFQGDIPKLPKSIKKVGVFVNASIEDVLEKVEIHDLHAVQLHGDESVNFCKQLQSKTLEIIKVFSIQDDFNFEVLKPYEDCCDYFLFDTKGKLPGGNGYVFDWTILNNYPSTKPYFLSGGIGLDHADNVKAFKNSKASTYCHILDVNSKFEIQPGLKHIELLKEFKSQL